MIKLLESQKKECQNYNQEQLNDAFIKACENGDLVLIQYLLTSPDLQEHANIHAKKNLGLRWACEYGHLDVVKYLLTSPELTEHADVSVNKYAAFQHACREQHFEVVKYLLSYENSHDIHFQNIDHDVKWAINHQYNEIIIAMMNNLQKNDFLEYMKCLPNIKHYNEDLYNYIQKMTLEISKTNPKETSLLL